MKFFVFFLSLSFNSVSQSNSIIDELTKSKVTTLDFFLYQLYDHTKCNGWVIMPSIPEVCMWSKPEVDTDANLIKLTFTARPSYADLNEKRKQISDKEISKRLVFAIESLKFKIGLSDAQSGLIYIIPFNWSGDTSNKAKDNRMKQEFVKITELYLHISYKKHLYKVKRSTDGKITISKILMIQH